jgi:hypothetical protein
MSSMSGISGISGLGAGAVWPTSSATTPAAEVGGGAAVGASGASAYQDISALSYSSMSINASSESLAINQGGGMAAASTNELLGAVLLLLTLQYMKSGDDQEKKDLLGLMTTLVQQMGQSGQSSGGSGGGDSLSYTSSSLSIEMTNLQVVSASTGINSYMSAQGDYSQSPGAGGIDVAA